MSGKPTKWVPTEEELVSLGFKKKPSMFEHSTRLWFRDLGTYHVFKKGITFFYPKSIGELRLLISMMNP